MYRQLIVFGVLCAQMCAHAQIEIGEGVPMGYVPTEVMYGYDSPQAKAERENREWNRKRRICEDIDCYTQDTEHHETDDDGYLIINDQETLEKYARRGKKALLKCSYFKYNYPKNYERLKRTEQEPFFIPSGLTASDGYQMWFRACGEWRTGGKTYYQGSNLNAGYQEGRYGCYWESTIIHEVLHTSGLVHPDDESMKRFKKILSKCNVLDEPTMHRWFFETPYTPGTKVTWQGQTSMSYDHRIWNKIKAKAGMKISKMRDMWACDRH